MSQLQAYRLSDGRIVLDVQSNYVETGSRVVAPLLPRERASRPIPVLQPVFDVDGQEVVMLTGQLATLPERLLRTRPIEDLTDERDTVQRALDILFLGF